jgi:predicted metal-dependent phosphoesterase TrpH
LSADLHVHSNASDGSLTPTELVGLAISSGLSTISLTDHDTVAGVDQALAAAVGTNLEVVPGIELNTDWYGVEVHILGYYPEYRSARWQIEMKALRQAREERAARIIKRLAILHISVNYSRVAEIAGKATIGRPHIARAMLEVGAVSSIREAFDLYLGQGKPAYTTNHRLDPNQAIELVAEVGGIPVLAHPGLMNRDELIPGFMQHGLLGIEVYYPRHDQETIDKLVHFCQLHQLLMTGGSDFHGLESGYPPLGTATVPKSTVEELHRLHRSLS